MFFIFQVPYGLCLDGMYAWLFAETIPHISSGTQFTYLNEIFPTHI
jgi:hypothetical protein